jgi:putative acetyltransferase
MMGKKYTLNDGREISIRQLAQEDKDQLTRLYKEMSPKITNRIQLPDTQQLYQKFRFPDYYISIVTEHNGKVFGYGEIMKDPKKKKGKLQIHLHQDYHGVGLGTAMMIILLKEATEQRLQRINLEVAAENHTAIHLFRKFGFQTENISKMKYPSGELHDTIYMTRALHKET